MDVTNKSFTRGFTLIELMVVVAIIGLLASIAMPLYTEHIGKAKVAAGLGEISGAKSAFEEALNSGVMITSPTAIGLKTETKHCQMMTLAYAYIACVIQNGPEAVNGSIILLGRTPSPENKWICGYIPSDGANAKYAPKGCLADGG